MAPGMLNYSNTISECHTSFVFLPRAETDGRENGFRPKAFPHFESRPQLSKFGIINPELTKQALLSKRRLFVQVFGWSRVRTDTVNFLIGIFF